MPGRIQKETSQAMQARAAQLRQDGKTQVEIVDVLDQEFGRRVSHNTIGRWLGGQEKGPGKQSAAIDDEVRSDILRMSDKGHGLGLIKFAVFMLHKVEMDVVEIESVIQKRGEG